MKSTIKNDLRVENGVLHVVPKEYPDWYGIPGIGFICRGTQSDPDLEYRGNVIDAYVIEDTMWERFNEECEENGATANTDLFAEFMRENTEEVYYLLSVALGLED